MSRGHRLIGTRYPRLDAVEKVTGRARFAEDLTRPRMLHGALLHSPLAHARILHIDTSSALRLPGVKAVLTAKNSPCTKFGVSPARHDETVFCTDRVRYVGDEVAAVAAVDRDTALEALALIRVDYEELPVVLDGQRALEAGAPQLHELYPGNVVGRVEQHFGDVDAAHQDAFLLRTDTLRSTIQDAAFLEPQCALAEVDSRGRLELFTSTQAPHYVARTVALVLGLPACEVRVRLPYVGGGFGPKAAASSLELATCLLARATGRPVRTRLTRQEVFLHSRARHQFTHTMTTGVDREGRLLLLDHQALLDGGAYASFGIATVYYAGSLLAAPYRLPNMRYRGVRVVTNKPACGAQRGHGGVVARALFELQLSVLADELGLDPVEIRLRNAMHAGEVTCNDLAVSSLGLTECLQTIQERVGGAYLAHRTRAIGEGIGVAAGFFVSGAGYPIYRSETPHAAVLIRLDDAGGSVVVETSAAEIGQGSDTVFAAIAAETIGIPIAAVRVRSGDTDLPVDLGAYSSRTTLMTGNATRQAAEKLRAEILSRVAPALGVKAEALDFDQGVLCIAHAPVDTAPIRETILAEHRGWPNRPRPEDPLTFAEVSRFAFLCGGPLVATGTYTPPKLGGSFKGATVGTSPAYGCSAQMARVLVNIETGQVQVREVVAAHDCGQAINLTQVEGQLHGCVSMGIGQALLEEVVHDEAGQVVNPSFGGYRPPTSLDMPEILRTAVVQSNEPNGPFGAKEVGEGGIMPTIPAILSAIYDATGIIVDELPATPQRILEKLRSR